MPVAANYRLIATLLLALTPLAPVYAATTDDDSEGEEEVMVTARYREERAQDVPIALSVLDSELLNATGTYSVSQIASLTPTVQFVSSNPRNTTINIRGFGSSFGLANDGLEPGVGVYIDQVYNPRPGTATFDLIDIDRIEILRGPQGTLFGKNTSAGAVNITTRGPTFEPESQMELSGGNFGFVQGKAAFSGPLYGDVLAGRISLVGTRRDGTIDNIPTDDDINEQNNVGIRSQLLYAPRADLSIRLIGDFSRQKANCCTQVFARVGTTQRAASRQYESMAATLGYEPPSRDPFDRKADINSGARADQKNGGATAIIDWDVAGGTLTSVSSWRFWEWRPLNDRDYTSLSILTASSNPSDQEQYSQELRFAGSYGSKVDYIAGVYAFTQSIETNGLQGYGEDAAFWLIGPSVPANLLDGYQSNFIADSSVDSYAVFAQANWHLTDKLTLTPGLRYTYEQKDATYDQTVSGGLATNNPTLIARQRGIVRPQYYAAEFADDSVSGQVNLSYLLFENVMAYGTYARGFKSGGINLAGIPNDPQGNPALTTAVVGPEKVRTFEVGVKSEFPVVGLTLNLAAFHTTIKDYQTTVIDNGPGALRGYLANIDKVRNRGVEIDATWQPIDQFTGYASAAINDGEYVSFENAPCPLEQVGGADFCDLSGGALPGVSDYAVSTGGEYRWPVTLRAFGGEFYAGGDLSYRSSWYSDPSLSRFSRIDGNTVVNLRAGVRSNGPWDVYLWVRNVFDEEYFLLLSNQSGNSGLVTGIPADPRTYGITLRASF